MTITTNATTAHNMTHESVEPDLSDFVATLTSLGIKHVISIDDEWKNYDSNVLLHSEASVDNQKLETNINSFFDDYARILSDSELSEISKLDLESMGELIQVEGNTNLNQLVLDGRKYLGMNRGNIALSVLSEVLDSLTKQNGIRTYKFSDNSFVSAVQGIEGRILFLLDRNMSAVGGREDEVVDKLITINSARKDNFDVVVVYSHENLSSYNNHEKKVDYVASQLSQITRANPSKILNPDEQKYLLSYQLWGINKTEKKHVLASSLVNILEKAAFGESLYQYLTMRLEMNKEAMLDLISLPENTFESLYTDAFIEGEPFLDILERTQQSIFNKIENNGLAREKNIETLKYIMEISKRKSTNILNSIKESGDLLEFRKQVQEKKLVSGGYKGISEYGLIDYTINKTFEDLSTGDLFRIKLHSSNKVKYGLLINAGCDVIVRFSGKTTEKIERKETGAQLLLFSNSSLNAKKTKEKIVEGKESTVWPVNIQGQYYCLSPSDPLMLNIDIRLLDLCTLNEDGWSNLQYSPESFEVFKTYHYNQYVEKEISQWVIGLTNLVEYLPFIKSSNKEKEEASITALKGIKESMYAELAGLKYSVCLDHTNNRFDIQRIGRLDSRRTLELIQKYSNATTRIGNPSVPFAQ